MQTATVALEIRFLNSLAIGDFGGDWRREFNVRNLDLLLDAGPQNESVVSLENQIAIDARRAAISTVFPVPGGLQTAMRGVA